MNAPLVSRRQLLRTGLVGGTAAAAGCTAVGSVVLGRGPVAAGDPPLEEVASVSQPRLRLDESRPLLERATAQFAHAADGPGVASAAPSSVVRASEIGVEPFEVIGVDFTTGLAAAERHVRLRVRSDGRWGPWVDLQADGSERPDDDPTPPGRAWTAPAWTGGADAYELDLPADATDVVVKAVRATDEVEGYAEVPTVESFAAQPSIRPRSAWVARPVGSIPVSSTLQLAIIHHSAGTNNYSPSQVPGIIRGIQNFHIDGRGWSDIAYNFVVDKFGTIWEARAGGVAKPVIGGHTYGHNSRTVGICYLGDLTQVTPGSAAVHAITRLVAWKLGLHGVDPRGGGSYTDYQGNTKYLRNVIGHRDAGSTSCPGSLHGHLGSIREQARVAQQPFPDIAVDGFYEDAVIWALLTGITRGVGDTGLFKPDDVVTRGQMATFLHRMMDLAPPTVPNRFTDVPPQAFFTTAVRWLDEAKVTTGFGGSSAFQPDAMVTRGQMATFLHRMAGEPAASGPSTFTDVAAGAFYGAPVAWMEEHGITTGSSGSSRFLPDAPVTRAEAVTFLFRLARTPQAWFGPVPSTVLF